MRGFQAAWHSCLLASTPSCTPLPEFSLTHPSLPLGDPSHQGKLLPSPSWGGGPGSPSHSSAPSSSPVPYDICRPDHSVLTLQLPVTASVREVMAALAQKDGWTKGQVLVKVNSAGGELSLEGRVPLRSMPRFPKLRSLSSYHHHQC